MKAIDPIKGTALSRRQLLCGSVVAGSSVAVLLTTAMPAQAKMNFQAAGYQPTPKDDQTCATCSLFQSPSSCILVDGTISPKGWCRFYRKKS